MKKLLSILTISTLTASVPVPLLANTLLTRVKRDVGTTTKDVTIGLDIKIKEKLNKWEEIEVENKPFNNVDNKYYYVIWRSSSTDGWKIMKLKNDTELSDGQDKTLDYKNNHNLILYKAPYFPIDLIIKKLNKPVAVSQWRNDNGTYFKTVYRWNGTNEPNLPEIISSTGKIIDDKVPTKNDFQQGISFALADGSKTATWSNAGMRLTVDGEINININNPNITEVYWDGVKQNMLEHKVNINVKPETSEKTHKLVIKYDINGTKYTSEDIDVVMAAKIEPIPTPTPKQLNELIKNTDLGNIIDNNDDTIKAKIIEKNSLAIDFSQIEMTKKDSHSANFNSEIR